MTDVRQAKPYASFLHSLGWKTETHPQHGYTAGIRLLLPFFGILKLQRVTLQSVDFSWLKRLTRGHLIFVSYIELADQFSTSVHAPAHLQTLESFSATLSQAIKSHGYSPLSHGMLPSKTQTIDLSQSLETIKADMKPKTRYNIGYAQRKKVAVSLISSQDFLSNTSLVNEVNHLLQKNAHRAGYWVEGKSWIQKKLEAFDQQAFILAAYSPGDAQQLLAVAFFLHSADTLFYWVNGSTQEGRKLFAPSLLIFEALLEAKKRDIKQFDFDGVYDERFPNKRWLGYTRFKQGFGGNYVYYPPCFIKRFAFFR